MNGPEYINSVPPIMTLPDRIAAAWGVLRGQYNLGRVPRLRKRAVLYRFKPFVLEARFSFGQVIMQCGPVESVQSYEAIARRELLKRAPWVGDAGALEYLRVIDRKSWLVSFEEGSRG